MKFKKFDKSQRSTFEYWFYHVLAFNLVAIKLKAWKPRYLFHDIEKPWLRLIFLGNYPKVQKWHRTHNSHHLEYRHPSKRNWVDMAIDWECSGLTKVACPRTAIQETDLKYHNHEINDQEYQNLFLACKKLNIL